MISLPFHLLHLEYYQKRLLKKAPACGRHLRRCPCLSAGRLALPRVKHGAGALRRTRNVIAVKDPPGPEAEETMSLRAEANGVDCVV